MNNQITQLSEIKFDIERYADKFRSVLPDNITVERFATTAITAVANNPNILRNDKRSILNAIMRAAQDGLMPDNREAALISYGGSVRYMPMCYGIVKKMYEAGLDTITANIVYENDKFEYDLGEDEKITHKPAPLGTERGKPIGAYCIAKMKNSAIFREVMNMHELLKVQNSSKAGKSSVWLSWWDEMAKKSVIKRLAKRCPLFTSELSSVLQADNDAIGIDKTKTVNQEPTDAELPALAETGTGQTSRLKSLIATK